MLHTWQNAAYFGNINFGKKVWIFFWKTVWIFFGKSEDDFVFWKMTGRSLG
jgi:hypothetical protein